MKSIAILSSHAPSLVNFRGPLIAELVSRGVRVIAMAPNFDSLTTSQIRDLGAEVVTCRLSRAGLNPLIDALNTLYLARTLRRLKVDVVFAYFVKPVIFGTLAAWLARVPSRIAMIEGLGTVFTNGAGTVSMRKALLQKGVAFLYRVALSKAHRVVVLNKDDAFDLSRLCSLPSAKISLLGPISVELLSWPLTSVVKSPVVFLFAARLLREKGVFQFAEAARIIKKSNKEVSFILLGALDPEHTSVSADEINNWVNEGLLEWHGHAPIKPWMARASVFVLPSYYREGVPRTLQEAMAMGRPVITTDSPGCRDTVVEGENGFLVPVRDAGALAQKMQIFIDCPELIETMGRSAREFAEMNFDAVKANKILLQFLM